VDTVFSMTVDQLLEKEMIVLSWGWKLGELHGDVHVGQAHGHMEQGVVVDGATDLIPDHVLTSILFRESECSGSRTWFSARCWSAADAQPRVTALIRLLTLETQPQHLLGSGHTPGGDRGLKPEQQT